MKGRIAAFAISALCLASGGWAETKVAADLEEMIEKVRLCPASEPTAQALISGCALAYTLVGRAVCGHGPSKPMVSLQVSA
jgi:hypothetical protein